MSDEVTRQVAEAQAERDNWQQRAEVLESSAHRVTAEIQSLTAERDAARADNIRLTDLCNNWQKQCQLHYDNLQRMIGKRDALVAERDAALVEVRSQLAEIRVISVDRDSAQDHNGFLREKCQKLEAERDAALADLDEANVNNHGLTIEVANMRAGLALATAERDAAERERTESRAEVVRVRVERDAALTEKHCLRLELEQMRAEAEGLRADLLAHPPEHAARIAELEADLAQVRYERDTAVAASRERHAANAALWESQQEQQRQAESIIEGLEECLEKTEKRYIEAKARQVPRALVGLLGVIRREAAAAEKMIL